MIKKTELQDEFDKALAERYGGVIEGLQRPPKINRGIAAFFVWFQFYRNFL